MFINTYQAWGISITFHAYLIYLQLERCSNHKKNFNNNQTKKKKNVFKGQLTHTLLLFHIGTTLGLVLILPIF